MPKTAKPRRFRRSSGPRGNVWLWIVVGVAVLFGIFLLTRTLSTSAENPPPIPILSMADPNLEVLTRMLGEIGHDSTAIDRFPDELQGRIATVDSQAGEGNWPDAIENLTKLRKAVPEDRLAAYHEYLGFCFHKSARPDRALAQFRNAYEAADSTDDRLRGRMSFCIAHLFLSRGLADSAAALYEAAYRLLGGPDTTDPILPALFNNFGVALEATGDSTRAFELYASAAALVDTLDGTSQSRTVRDNVRRLVGRRQTTQNWTDDQ